MRHDHWSEPLHQPAQPGTGMTGVRCIARTYVDFRVILDTYKLTLGCADCSYRDFAGALDLDHRPGTKRLFRISSSFSRSLESVIRELEKCDVVCANCHRRRTSERGNTGGRPRVLGPHYFAYESARARAGWLRPDFKKVCT